MCRSRAIIPTFSADTTAAAFICRDCRSNAAWTDHIYDDGIGSVDSQKEWIMDQSRYSDIHYM